MTMTTFPVPPEAKPHIDAIVSMVRKWLEKGQEIDPVAFLFSDNGMHIFPVPEDDGDATRGHIQHAARIVGAHFVFFVSEAWHATAESGTPYSGSVKDMPGSCEVVAMVLETQQGCWLATPEIRKHPISKFRRTMAEPVFEFEESVRGRLAGMLPTASDGPAS